MGRFFGDVPVVGIGNAFLPAFQQALQLAKRDALVRRQLAVEDDQRRRQNALADFNLAQQGVHLTPKDYTGITPGSLGPSPVDRVDVSGASPSAANDRIAAETIGRAVAGSAAVKGPVTTDPTAPVITTTAQGTRYGNGWYQDLDEAQANADRVSSGTFNAELGKAFAAALAERMANPDRATLTDARVNHLNALTAKVGQTPATSARPPVRGTQAYLDALNSELALRAQYRQPTAGRDRLESPVLHALRVASQNTRQALTETDSQIRGLDQRAANAVVPSDTLGLGTQRAGLVQRADSLRSAYDQQSAGYQRLGLGGGTATLDRTVAPTTATHPKLDAATEQRFEADLNRAGLDLKAVLDSDAPPTVKAKARQLHSQHVRALMQQYGLDQ